MKKFYFLLVAMLIGGALIAQPGMRHHWGPSSYDNEAFIEQSGSQNNAVIMQVKAEPFKWKRYKQQTTAYVYQDGDKNEAYIEQKGWGNMAGGDLDLYKNCCAGLGIRYVDDCLSGCCKVTIPKIYVACAGKVFCGLEKRRGLRLALGVFEYGYKNDVALYQTGALNAAAIHVGGKFNDVFVDQYGVGNKALVEIRRGWDNTNVIKQYGWFNTAIQTVGPDRRWGSDNCLFIRQDNWGDCAYQEVTGDDNHLSITQDGFWYGGLNSAMQIVKDADDNKLYIDQFGMGNDALQIVTGDDNEAAIEQWGWYNNAFIHQ